MMIADIVVANCQIRAALPAAEFQHIPMPTNEVERIIWFETIHPERLNRRVYGKLKGRALKKAQKLVDSDGAGIGMSGEVGSILINPDDFVPTLETKLTTS